MGTKDPRIDKYIANAAGFARPILSHIRELVHKGCPDVTENMKWSSPFFEYKGVLCSMAAFKEHCAFGFWRRDLKIESNISAMGDFGRLTSVNDLPSDKVLLGYIRQAAKLNESGVKPPPRVREAKDKKDLVVPKVLLDALKKNPKAAKTFENFSYSHKKEYAEWIAEAKREETQQKRLAQAIEWLAEGKSRNWKYQNC